MNRDISSYVKQLSSYIFSTCPTDTQASVYYSGEQMDYVRFNQSKVRQLTRVDQGHASLSLQSDQRESHFDWSLCWDLKEDSRIAQDFISIFQSEKSFLDQNPEVTPSTGKLTSEHSNPSKAIPELPIICDFLAKTGVDLAGLLTSGNQWRASLNCHGQSHWFDSESHFFDYSLYTVDPDHKNKALKSLYYSRDWHQYEFETHLLNTKSQLEHFKTPSIKIPPGKYRTYLAPAAVGELIGLLSWGALSYDAYKKGLSPLKKLVDQEVTLSDKFSLRENFELGLTTPFNSRGEITPTQVELIVEGRIKNFLLSTASATEYQAQSNFAESGSGGKEYLRSPELLAGQLASRDVLKALGTGLYLGHLHYCNWSDQPSARITGMTRFGCFWVEEGQIKSPIHDFRFDVSLYDIFGPEGLEALTLETEIIPHTGTYFMRALGGMSCSGALIKEFACVL